MKMVLKAFVLDFPEFVHNVVEGVFGDVLWGRGAFPSAPLPRLQLDQRGVPSNKERAEGGGGVRGGGGGGNQCSVLGERERDEESEKCL